MTILNDAQFMNALNETDTVLPRSLWDHLNGLAEYLTLVGALDEALQIWRFAYGGSVVVQTSQARGDCSVTSFCQTAGLEDVSRGLPSDPCTDIGASLKKRAAQFDDEIRYELTLDVWSPICRLEHIELARRARSLARPSDATRFNPRELDVLPLLEAFIVHPEAHPHAVLQSLLLAADICWRNEQGSRARDFLLKWHQGARPENERTSDVLGLRTTCEMVCQGALATVSELALDERRALIARMLDETRARLADYAPPPAPCSLHTFVFHNTLRLEPAADENWEEAFIGEEEPLLAPDASYPACVCLWTPGETGSCTLELESRTSAPLFKECALTVAFPLRVVANTGAEGRVGTLFPSDLGKEDVGLDAPLGDWDVFARFFRERGDEGNENVGLRHWRVKMVFLPRGTAPHFGTLHLAPNIDAL